ncbi:energy-coupling factor transporter transmembrane component T family protein [Caldalkalibacillus mannanilyticus]|uniref:energy-coupling factor transporter transmembrane component T family protein n=1 Tax=Caldalkalibacillus mannanilyticus TaxID=1418 RepID=UPI000469426C|nr:energy-coupling factor transporter transmembrane component T [Caldalkalibacillus mannanilyticus]
MIFQYQPGNSCFHRLDPLSKFIWLLCVSILSLWYESALIQSILFLCIVGAGIGLANMNLRSIWKGLRIPFWFGLPYFVLQLIFLPGETVLWTIGAWFLTAEALDFALAITCRLLILFLASLLYIKTTDPQDVVLVLAQKLHIPYRFAFAISLALRFLPLLESEAEQIRNAQRRRGLGQSQGIKAKLAWAKRFIFSVFVSAVRRAETTAIMMEGKGFGLHPERTYRRWITISPAGLALSLSSVFLTLFFLFWVPS